MDVIGGTGGWGRGWLAGVAAAAAQVACFVRALGRWGVGLIREPSEQPTPRANILYTVQQYVVSCSIISYVPETKKKRKVCGSTRRKQEA